MKIHKGNPFQTKKNELKTVQINEMFICSAESIKKPSQNVYEIIKMYVLIASSGWIPFFLFLLGVETSNIRCSFFIEMQYIRFDMVFEHNTEQFFNEFFAVSEKMELFRGRKVTHLFRAGSICDKLVTPQTW